MTFLEIQNLARQKGIYVDEMSTIPQLIREIQKIEGNKSCFGSFDYSCPYQNCCWRKNCLGLAGNTIKARHLFNVVGNERK